MSRLFRQQITWRLATLMTFEMALIVGAVLAAAYVRLGVLDERTLTEDNVLANALLIAAASQICFYYRDLYSHWIIRDGRDVFVRMLQALGAASCVLAALYYWFPALIIGRGVFAIASGLVIVLVIGWRLAFGWFARHVMPRERLLLVGTSPAAVALARELFERHEFGVTIVGFIDPDPARLGMPVLNPGVIGAVEDIRAIVRAQAIDRVVVSLADARGRLPMDKLLAMKIDGVTFDHLASVYEEYTGKIAVENLRPSWLIFSSGFRKSAAARALKRAIDLVAASVALVGALPVLAILAAAVKLTSHGPALYHQPRVGRHGRLFQVHKLRSMRADAEQATGAVWATAGDDRVTRVGRVLRRTRLDELPQLWNIIRGDMSLVGPRPERPEFVSQLTRTIPFYGERHAIQPGLTGWAQVRYTYGATVEDALEKLQYDLFYVKNMSLSLDVVIILDTIKTVLLGRGAR